MIPSFPHNLACSLIGTIACIFLVRGGDSLATNKPSMALGLSFSNNQTLQSANGLFQFGFFSLPSGSSSRWYLGIWYSSIKPFTSVWVANKEQPVSQMATFSLSVDGQFTLLDASKVVWTIGGSGLNVSTLTLMDTGNLVLESSNSTRIWQSFEHQGNTWLPTMTLSKGQKIQSWLTPNDPSPGTYSIQLGSSNNFVFVFNDSLPYWDSGAWNGEIFANIPDITKMYKFTFNSSRLTMSLYPNVDPFYNISRFVMTSSGIMQESSFNPTIETWKEYWYKPTDQCNVSRVCGQNSICKNAMEMNYCRCPSPGFQPTNEEEWAQQVFIQGCSRVSTLDCSQDDGFISINQTSFDWNFTASFSTVHDQWRCQDLCLSNCSCNGFFFEAMSGNCSLFSQPLYNGRSPSSSSSLGAFYLRISAQDLIPKKTHLKSSLLRIIAGVAAVGAAVAILALASLAVFLASRRRKMAASKAPEAGLRTFSYADMKTATKHFKEKLGSGGFGTVFKGVIAGFGGEDGGSASLAVAVKKLQKLDEGEKQFRAEVRTLGTIQHMNLVRLFGFCSEGKHRLLVYELAENGSLDQMLFHNNDPTSTLSWQHRLNIALGTARAMAYLHESCPNCIIHCDIKPENILLDLNYNAKVADFGLAKLIGREFTRVLTTLRGTRGYLAPEWIAGLPITAKADVYSFGMTLLELISGRRNIHADRIIRNTSSHAIFFPLRVAQLIQQPHADLTCIVDPRLQGNMDIKELQQMTYCAIWCIQDNEKLRPSMGKVVQILEETLFVNPPPIPTSLQCLEESESFYTDPLSKFSNSY